MRALCKYWSAPVVAATLILMGAVPADAAAPTGAVGADISYPQCSGSSVGALPGSGGTQPATFGIIGVNNGRPGAPNGCLSAEYSWAAALSPQGQTPQLYVNTADPGNTVADWPTGNVAGGPTDPYGTCLVVRSRGKTVGANSPACAFEYGVEQGQEDVAFAQAAAAQTSAWWLDVETANSWQTRGTIDMNQADLLGMVDTFQTAQTTVGAYSTHYQWSRIIGTYDSTAGSTLGALLQWIPAGGSSQSTAQSDCANATALPGFTNGARIYVQYTATYDYDVVC